MPAPVDPYDALLLVSFGGPERPDDVVPFLKNVTRGRETPRARLEQVGQHYQRFGGRSPINDQNRALLGAIRSDLAEHGVDAPVYWGNRNWDPFLRDTLRQMAADGVRRAACLLTSAYPSYSGCRQYRENLHDAFAEVEGAPVLDRLRHYCTHPGFVDPFVDATRDALSGLPDGSRLVFVTHSIPESMAAVSGRSDAFAEGHAYELEHRVVAAEVARRVGHHSWDLVFCSRSGPPNVPWLEPDVNDHLEQLSDKGIPGVAAVPIGFVSDHMEVVYDLDTEARATADRLGMAMARVPTPGVDARFVAMVRELLLERAAAERGEPVERRSVAAAAGRPSASWDVCPRGCCSNQRGDRPALCGR